MLIIFFAFCMITLNIVYMIRKRKLSMVNLLSTTIATLILAIYLIDVVSQTREIYLTESFLSRVSSIDWDNKKTLINMGFQYENNYYILHIDSNEYLCSVTVSPLDDIPSDAKTFKDMKYYAQQTSLGIFNVSRLFIKKIAIRRKYQFYINNTQIVIMEDNKEKSQPIFEKFIQNQVA